MRKPVAFLLALMGIAPAACTGEDSNPAPPTPPPVTTPEAGVLPVGVAPANDCDCPLPDSIPAGCVEVACLATDKRACTYIARDRDGDGHRSNTCAFVGDAGAAIVLGDDCDDADFATYPGASESCDGRDRNCDGKPKADCACSQPGTTQECYFGPDGTAGFGDCKKGTQTCGSDGKWIPTCEGQALPTLGHDAPADAAHPCNGMNWWCDAAGVGAHCTCLTTDPAKSCGSALTCNASATQTCTAAGTWGTCSQGPQGVCQVGAKQNCTTCSTFVVGGAGTQTCNGGCAWDACVPNSNQGPVAVDAGTGFKHNVGHALSPTTGAGWAANATDANYPSALIYGSYVTLPAGDYHLKWKFKNTVAGTTAKVLIDVIRPGFEAIHLYPIDVPAGNNVEPQWDFRVPDNCSTGWEFRVFKNADVAINIFSMELTYKNP